MQDGAQALGVSCADSLLRAACRSAGRIRDESSVHALKIKEVDTRIEAEIAGLRSTIATAKINVLQYLVGVATGAGALLLAYLRMFK